MKERKSQRSGVSIRRLFKIKDVGWTFSSFFLGQKSRLKCKSRWKSWMGALKKRTYLSFSLWWSIVFMYLFDDDDHSVWTPRCFVIALINCLEMNGNAQARATKKESHQHKCDGHQCKAAKKGEKKIERSWIEAMKSSSPVHRAVHHDKAISRCLMFYMITIIVVITVIDFLFSIPFYFLCSSAHLLTTAFNTCHCKMHIRTHRARAHAHWWRLFMICSYVHKDFS